MQKTPPLPRRLRWSEPVWSIATRGYLTLGNSAPQELFVTKTLGWVILVVVAGAILSALYYRSQQIPLRAVPPGAQAPAPKPSPEPEIRYPIEEKPQEKPLPPLKQSDPAMKDTLRGLWNDKAIAQFF